MKAIAAMSPNRVIGRGGTIPWHLLEDFRWFKKMTTGGVVLMGRKTFASLGKPLPNRHHVILTRGPAIAHPEVESIHDLADFDEARYASRGVWLIGGADLYQQLLPRCTDLYLTVLNQTYEGDAYFPEFEPLFHHTDTPLVTPDFEVRHYVRAA
jgi:dihydrofolate reductase